MPAEGANGGRPTRSPALSPAERRRQNHFRVLAYFSEKPRSGPHLDAVDKHGEMVVERTGFVQDERAKGRMNPAQFVDHLF